MPNELTLLQRLMKNKLYSNSAWVVMLDININDIYYVKVCNNNENIVYGGDTYYAFPFSLELITLEDSKGEISDVTLKVSNLTGIIMNYIENTDGAINSTITISYINSKHLDEPAAYEETMKISSISYDDSWIEIKLSADYVTSFRISAKIFKRDFCDYQFKGIECGYNGSELLCNHSLKRCRELENETRFGGEPTIGSGFYVGS